MGNEVRVRATVDDKVSGPLGRIKDKIEVLGKKGAGASFLGNLGAKGVAVGIGLVSEAVSGLVNVTGDAIQAALDEERSLARLDAALKANVGGWSGNTAAIEKTLSARMALGFSDDEQRDSLALLLVATKNQTKALELQRTAMDLARLKGISLADASAALIKIEGGQFRMLKSLGIELGENATQTEALAAVQRAAEGQAAAYAETNGGKLLAAQIKVGEAMEKFGMVILPAVADGAVAAAGAITVLGDAVTFVVTEFTKGADMFVLWDEEFAKVPGRLDKSMVEIAAGIRRGQSGFRSASSDLAGVLPDAVDTAADEAVAIARRTPQDLADALQDKRDAWEDAIDRFNEVWDEKLSTAAEIARIKGHLASTELARGLKSASPLVRAESVVVRDQLINSLQYLTGQTYSYGKNALVNFIAGMNSQLLAVDAAAERAAGKVSDNLRLNSPAKEGPLSEGGGPEGYGRKLVTLWADGMKDELNAVQAVSGQVAGMAFAGGGGGGGGAVASGGPLAITVYVQGGLMTPAVGQQIAREIGPYIIEYTSRRG